MIITLSFGHTLGVLTVLILIAMPVFSTNATDGNEAGIMVATVLTIVWCLVSIWVAYPLAKALKLANAYEIGVLSGLPLYGLNVIWKLVKQTENTLTNFA